VTDNVCVVLGTNLFDQRVAVSDGSLSHRLKAVRLRLGALLPVGLGVGGVITRQDAVVLVLVEVAGWVSRIEVGVGRLCCLAGAVVDFHGAAIGMERVDRPLVGLDSLLERSMVTKAILRFT
jgi:hypothetical protein